MKGFKSSYFYGDLIMVRGLPGSGKSTLAELFSCTIAKEIEGSDTDCRLYSADDFFTDEEGNYNYDNKSIAKAHAHCKKMTEDSMRQKVPKIVVHNTFTRKWEMEDYYKIAETYNYRVSSIIVENRHESGSIHNVPEDVIKKMEQRFDIQL